MNWYHRILLAAGGLSMSVAATAQQRESSGQTALIPEGQVEVALQGNDYLVATVNLIHFAGAGATTTELGQVRLGYEHFWNEHWSGGATVRVVGRYHQGNGDFLGMPGALTPGLLLRHVGSLGGVQVGQRLVLEYALPLNNLVEKNNRALTRLRLDAEHVFALGEKLAVRPRLAYEAALYLRLQRNQDQLQERFLDFGSLRGEVGLRFSPRFDVTPWAAYQTAYRNSLPFYNSSGQQVSGGRTNYVIPVVGLDVRLTLPGGAASAERRQLPTQH